MKKQTTSEIVLQFLIDKNCLSNDNKVNFTQADANSLHLPEKEIIRAFYLLQTDGCLKITIPNNEDNFDRFWGFELTSNGIHYFEKRLKERNANLVEWIRWGITSLIAIIALIVAIIGL